MFKPRPSKPDYPQVSLPFFDVLDHVHRHSLTKQSARIFLLINFVFLCYLGWTLYNRNFAFESVISGALAWLAVNIFVLLLIQGLDLLLLTQMRRQAVETCVGYLLMQPYCNKQGEFDEIRQHAIEMRNAVGLTVALPSAIISGLAVIVAVVALQQGMGTIGVLVLIVAGLCAAVGYVEHLERANACSVIIMGVEGASRRKPKDVQHTTKTKISATPQKVVRSNGKKSSM